jgi:hypothetical protein
MDIGDISTKLNIIGIIKKKSPLTIANGPLYVIDILQIYF